MLSIIVACSGYDNPSGNTNNEWISIWDVVPTYVLENHELTFDQKTLDECLKPENRTTIAEWDDDGNLL